MGGEGAMGAPEGTTGGERVAWEGQGNSIYRKRYILGGGEEPGQEIGTDGLTGRRCQESVRDNHRTREGNTG